MSVYKLVVRRLRELQELEDALRRTLPELEQSQHLEDWKQWLIFCSYFTGEEEARA